VSRFQFYGPGLPAIEAGELKGTLIAIEGADGVGRSTHIGLLKQWFENAGHAVLDTGMTRSALAGKGLEAATEGNTLGPIAMSLFYATDFADRLENEIIPALRAGFVVLTELVRRVVQTTGFNYWECGMDLHLGEDMYESFLEYQTRLRKVFDDMSGEYRFHVIDAAASIDDVGDELKNCLEPLFASSLGA
jgi:dTMP kinase